MPAAPQPRMHGLTHVPGGPDPIPGLGSSGTDPGDYYGAAVAIPDIRGYWRLGEPAGPFADTSGHNPALPANAAVLTGTAPLTPDITGALPTVYDDGAVDFNYPGTGADNVSQRLETINSGDGRFNFNTVEEGHKNMSVACWVKPATVAATFTDYVVTCFGTVAGSPSWQSGWGITLAYPSRTPTFTRYQNSSAGGPFEATAPGALTADQWAHLAGTFDGTTIRLYVNGALADTTADTHDLSTINHPVLIGLRSACMIDEVGCWARVLTAAEIAELAGMGAESSVAPAGYVLTANGTGGTSWELATVEVSY